VRLILGISLVLVGIGLWSCQIDGLAEPVRPVVARDAPWVRTVHGWERATWLRPAIANGESARQPARTPLHPLILGAGQLFISLLALAVFGGSTQPPVREKSGS
jgi:hypothetical protein